MPRRRLQCGGCGVVIKVSSHVTRPVCPRCNTAHTFIKCGKASCATLMCLPENINQFSCPRCGVQLARPGFAQAKGPTVVRCGNTACSFLLSVQPNSTKFSCPKCNVVQLLPGTEAASKQKERIEEERRQQEQQRREAATLAELCETFTKLGLDSNIIEAVFEGCNSDRSQAVVALTDIIQDPNVVSQALDEETHRQELILHHKKQAIDSGIRCPITHEIMDHPVFAADGFTYERKNIEAWFKDNKDISPVTHEPLASTTLVPNHQLRGEIESWKELLEEESHSHKAGESVILAVRSTKGGGDEGAGGGAGPPPIECENVYIGDIQANGHRCDDHGGGGDGGPAKSR